MVEQVIFDKLQSSYWLERFTDVKRFCLIPTNLLFAMYLITMSCCAEVIFKLIEQEKVRHIFQS